MPVVKRAVKGIPRWVIDRLFVGRDGTTTRYRRVAQIQNERAAKVEEQKLIEHWERHGCLPESEVASSTPTHSVQTRKSKPASKGTWEDAVKIYKRDGLPLVKPTTRRGYTRAVEGPWLSHWNGWQLDDIDRRAIKTWEAQMIAGGLAASSRRNLHIVLRITLKSVGPSDDGPGLLLEQLPKFPALPKVGRTAVEATEPHEVENLLANTKKGMRVAIALAAYAGLRSGEVRALTKSDIDLKNLTITVSKSVGADEITGTKSGHDRVIPIGPKLLKVLEPHLTKLKTNQLVSTNSVGKEWGDVGLTVAYWRVAKRLGLKSTKYHSLRHHFATQLFQAANADAITVKDLLGHADLSTTHRYAHYSHQRAVAAVAALG